MKVSRGKDFEEKFREQLEGLENISVDRFPDPMTGFLGVRNICDFGVYEYPFQYYIECKAFSGNTLNFKSGITENQWSGLTKKNQIKGVTAGILIWFIDYDKTVFVPIEILENRRQIGFKSLNIKEILEDDLFYIEMKGRKKRVFFDYDIKGFMDDLSRYTKEYWKL